MLGETFSEIFLDTWFGAIVFRIWRYLALLDVQARLFCLTVVSVPIIVSYWCQGKFYPLRQYRLSFIDIAEHCMQWSRTAIIDIFVLWPYSLSLSPCRRAKEIYLSLKHKTYWCSAGELQLSYFYRCLVVSVNELVVNVELFMEHLTHFAVT